MNQSQTLRTPLRALIAAGSLAMAAAAAMAQGPVDRSAIEAQFKADRQSCNSGQTMQASRSACLYDARLAREASLRGELGGESPVALERNRVQRCDAIPDESEDECIRTLNGEGEVTGSVEQGVIVGGDDVNALILAEQRRGDAKGERPVDHRADAACQRHLRDRDGDAAVGDVVDRR